MSISLAVTAQTLDGGTFVAGACLVVGVALIAAGAFLGLRISTQGPARIAEAKGQLDDAQERIHSTRTTLESLQTGGLEAAGGVAGAGQVLHQAAADAESSTDAAKSALEQVSGIVGALPENLRFAGLLVLVGTALVSVATIQFGGTSLF